jgi:hypothetical protein
MRTLMITRIIMINIKVKTKLIEQLFFVSGLWLANILNIRTINTAHMIRIITVNITVKCMNKKADKTLRLYIIIHSSCITMVALLF